MKNVHRQLRDMDRELERFAIESFLEWLQGRGLCIARCDWGQWDPARPTLGRWTDDYFEARLT